MPKIKVPKKSPSLDMTPMVDLAFLLVTFFMLTTKFRPDEPVVVDQPSSVSDIALPDKGVLMLTVDGKGRVFFNVEGQQMRKDILDRLSSHFDVK
jgi:biopolymer transport protein ExbD